MSFKISAKFLFLCLLILFSLSSLAYPEGKRDYFSKGDSKRLTLLQASMCEGVENLLPRNRAIVFSIINGKVFCHTSFDPVPEKVSIYHNWFYRDKLSTSIKLSLKPPRWATYSSIKLRESDKGPWRVEITDKKGVILHILRFSITD